MGLKHSQESSPEVGERALGLAPNGSGLRVLQHQAKLLERSRFRNHRRVTRKGFLASVSYAIQQDLEGNAAKFNGRYLMKNRHPLDYPKQY